MVLRLDDPVTTGSRDGQITARREGDRRRQDVDVAVGRNAPMLILAGGTDALPDVARRLAVRVQPWPELTAGDIVEILRVTHSRTGCLSEAAIRSALPPAERAAALPTILWERALTEVSPIRVARQLAAFCAESPKPKGPTLADLHGQPAVRAELEALVQDVEAWRAEQLDWSEVTSSFLLTGPPGVGKTMTAAALAGSADVHLVSTSYGACQAAGHLGDYLKAMTARVDEAIERTPSVFFLDEIDSLPPSRRRRSLQQSLQQPRRQRAADGPEPPGRGPGGDRDRRDQPPEPRRSGDCPAAGASIGTCARPARP